MLFIRSNGLSRRLEEGERLRLLDALAARGLAPLARSARRRCFESLLAGGGADVSPQVAGAADDLERLCAEQRVAAGNSYTPGELFCAADCLLFLLFDGGADAGLTAGIVYSLATTEPLLKLDRFCRDVREALIRVDGAGAPAAAAGAPPELPCWKAPAHAEPRGLARFVAMQPTDFAVAAKCRASARGVARASELLEDDSVRQFLRRAQELRREGCSPRRVFEEAEAALQRGRASVEKMIDAGLLAREVTVSCRKSGHPLFDLPSPDSLAAITISKARCSLCAEPVVDELIEETLNPSPLAVALLEGGGWLAARVYKIVRSLGVPDSEIATGPASAHGESYLAAEVCGGSFLFVTKDGDLTPALGRRVAATAAETEATHLVVVTTGAVEEEARLRLYEFAWRCSRDGRDLNVTLVEGPSGVRAAIRQAFESATHRELSRRLFPVDAALGMSAAGFVLDWFRLAVDSAAGARRAGLPAPTFPELTHPVAP